MSPPLWVARVELDNHEWQWQSGPYDALGFTFTLRSDHRALGEELHRLLSGFTGPAAHEAHPMCLSIIDRGKAAEPDRFVTYLDEERASVSPGTDHLVRILLWQLTPRAVAAATDRLVIHAGAVARRGRAIVIPGSPDAGKSTLTAALLDAGCEFLSDEAAVLNLSTGLVEAFPRPLSLDPGSFSLLPHLAPHPATTDLVRNQWFVVPDEVAPPCPPAMVILPHVRPGTASELEPVTRSTALVALAESAFNLGACGSRGFRALGEVVRRATCVRLYFGQLPGTADLILRTPLA